MSFSRKAEALCVELMGVGMARTLSYDTERGVGLKIRQMAVATENEAA